MLLLSQDKKKLIEIKTVEVTKMLGGKNEKYCLTALAGAGTSMAIVGKYPDEQTAYAELMRIAAAIEIGQPIYYVS